MSLNTASAVTAPLAATKLQVFSTCPSSSQIPKGKDYVEQLIRVARWSEKAGCTGSLIYTDNSLADPWLVASILAQNTEALAPLIAVQPVYMHPYSVAKMVATIGHLYRRRVFLNMVAGGFKNDLSALNDPTPHDQRYERLTEYTKIISSLLEGRTPVTFEGDFYQVRNLTLAPPLDPALRASILMSGSSEAGMVAAQATGAIAVQYPEPPENCMAPGFNAGMRVGIIARASEGEAWAVADARFPEDRKGRITRFVASQVSDSSWHKRLSNITTSRERSRQTYWLHPFSQYQTNCPYLVGSYEEVAIQVARYLALGYSTFILDIPAAEEEFHHIGRVLGLATSAGTLASVGDERRI